MEWEQASVSFNELQSLFNAHYLEIYGENIEVESKMFKYLESQGKLFFLVTRDSGRAVGYYAVSTCPSVYDHRKIEAKDVGIYVIPEYRKQGITTKMQEVMDIGLKTNNVHSVYVSYPSETTIPTNAGYIKKEIIYERKL